jgi:hypothetical protein
LLAGFKSGWSAAIAAAAVLSQKGEHIVHRFKVGAVYDESAFRTSDEQARIA